MHILKHKLPPDQQPELEALSETIGMEANTMITNI
jgi:hypothetical protein